MLFRALVPLLALGTPAAAQWHPAPDEGARAQRLRLVAPDLAALVAADPAGRPALERRVIERHVPERLDALRRFRNPELAPLFRRLLEREDWTAVHRALFVLERMGDGEVLARARTLADEHPHARVREKARITVRILARDEPPPAEPRTKRPDGLLLAHAPEPEDAPPPQIDRSGPRVSDRWVAPTRAWDAERGRHADGAGIYACAAGVVERAGPKGIAVLGSLPGKLPVLALYDNVGPAVFVEEGDRVEAGALLGTIGLGGLRFALRDGDGAELDAVAFLERWRALTAPLLPPGPRQLHRKLRRAVAAAGKGRYGRADEVARRVRDRADPGSEAHADAVYLVGLLARVPAEAERRARGLRAAGFPTAALDGLEEHARACRGLAGAGALSELAAAWKDDPAFARALEGERKLAAALRARNADRRAQRLRRLRADYGDTCLAARFP